MKKLLIFVFIAYAPLLMAKRVLPGYTFKKGQTFEYLLTQEQKLDMTVIHLTGRIEQTNTYTLHFEVKDAEKNEANLIFKLKAFGLSVKDLNDTKKISTLGHVQGLDSLIKKHIINRSYFIRMDKYGNIVSITPPEFRIIPYKMDTLQYDALMEFSDKGNIKTLINQVFMVYPRNDIFPGDSWSNIHQLDAGIPILEISSMEISSIAKGVNTFKLEGSFSANKNKLLQSGVNPEETVVNGQLKGQVKTSRKTGLTISKIWEGDVEGELWMDENKVLLNNKMSLSVQLLD